MLKPGTEDGGQGQGQEGARLPRREPDLFWATFRSMPTANTEGLDRIGRAGVGNVSGGTRL